MKVLVVGAAGFIGSKLCEALLQAGDSVTGIVRRPMIKRVGFPVLEVHDFHSPAFQSLLNEDTKIVCAAGGAKPGDSQTSGFVEIKENLVPFLNLIDATKAHPNIHIVHISSAGTVYGKQPGLHNENNSLLPISYHGAAKVATEAFLHSHCSLFNQKGTVLRLSNVYGPGQPLKSNFGFIRKLLGCVSNDETIEIWGDGSIKRDFLFVDDAVHAIQLALRSPPDLFSVLNIASGKTNSLSEVIDRTEEITKMPVKRQFVAIRDFDTPNSEIDVAAAEAVLGWKAKTHLAEGLLETWNWLKQQNL